MAVVCAAILAIFAVGNQVGRAQGQRKPGEGFAAIPGVKGGQDIFGPYEPVRNWPKPMSASLPGHENWTYSVTMDVFAESPNRVFLAQKGELPLIERRPQAIWLPQLGPGLQFPVFRLPLRQAGGSIPNGDELDQPGNGRPGVDWRWEHHILVVDANGNIAEEGWKQWDSLFVRPHDVEISPYDPQKHVWIVDAEGHAVFKFTNDGRQRVLTLGTPRVAGDDDTHFRRPTFLVFLPDGSMYLADGYDNTRVIKYDKDGKKLLQWGEKGTPPEKRPGYMNNVHGIGVDVQTRRVFVNDRANSRVQVFDENGKYLDEWSFGPRPPMDIHSFIVTSDRKLWAADQGTHKILGYDLNGHFLYSWGSWGEYPGGQWGVHGLSTDQEGNFYVAEVNNGRIQKYRPRQGANPEFLAGKPWKGVW
jgi:peptidylamidoglycolate lyase